MSKRSISIDRLEIRLKGISAETARAATNDLGRDILGQLSSLRNPAGGIRAVNKVDAGTVQLAGETRASELRNMIARKVAASIKSKMK
jgi:hypothetical protein